MSAMFGKRVSVAQANGSEVDLVVWGDEWYATYETPSGYTAVYDESRGLFCYAQVVDGRFVSTQVPVGEPPPADLKLHAREDDSVRVEKAAAKRALRNLTD